VVSSGELHSVRDVAEIAFAHVQLDWRDHVVVDDRFRRRDDVAASLVGDASRARERLGWQPEVAFDELIQLMVDADLARLDPERQYGPHLDWPETRGPLSLEGASPESR
jgi:GDPmannose 4,6-dehydratase